MATHETYLKQMSVLQNAIVQSADFIKVEQAQKKKAQAQFDKLKAEFEAHVRKNQAELLGSARSTKTPLGDFGFKKIEKIEMQVGHTSETVINGIKKRYKKRWNDFVELKEILKKTALRRLTDKQLASIGLKRENEAFWVTVR